MILSNYNQTIANKLIKLSIPDITDPFPIRILWLRSVTGVKKSISMREHQHSFFEVHLLLSGDTEYSDHKKKTYHVCAGEGILFPPGVVHTVCSYSEQMIKLCLAFSTEEETPLSLLLKKGTHSFPIDEKMRICLESILAEAERMRTFSIPLLKNSIFELICRIFRSADCNEQAPDLSLPETDLRIMAVRQYIKDNPNAFLTCQDVAQYCHFNVKYLNRIFKENTGMTLLSYIHQQKILQAQELLEHTTLSLDEISTRLGFANEYYFNSFFRRVSGITPGAYRLMIQ